MNDVMVVGGLFDSLLKSVLQWPDFSKVDHAMLIDGANKSFDSLKPAVNAIGVLLIDAAKTAFATMVEKLKAKSPLVVGASHQALANMVIEASRRRTKEEVDQMIRDQGGDPAMFAPWVLLVLQILPTAIDLIKRLLGK